MTCLLRALSAYSDLLELCRLLSATSAIVFDHKAHSIALLQRPNAGGLERGRMNEYVLAALVRLDESKALSGIEEFLRCRWP
jgi:hypothetical protein